jgi:hypothetical protein
MLANDHGQTGRGEKEEDVSDLDAVRKAFAALQARVAYLEKASQLFVDDASLDRHHGDPKVRFAPKSWRGPDFVGKTFSKCSPEFLESLAEALTWAANNPKPDKAKYAEGNRTDAARCRSWARRIRAKAQTTAPATNGHAKPEAPAQRPAASGQPPAADDELFDQEGDEGLSDDLFHDDERDQDDDLFGGGR